MNITNYTNKIMQNTKNKCQNEDSKLCAVYRMDFVVKLREKGYRELFTKPNPQKPWLQCWYFLKTEEFMNDLQKLIGGVHNGR